MFGAADPEQAISQLEAYHREGKGERVEVMASALVDQLMAKKGRDDNTQGILVKGLRILASVLNSRQKYKRARITIGLLHKHRNKHGKAVGHDLTAAAADYHLAGFIHANAGKKGAAKKAFLRCQKLQPGHLSAALDLAEQCGYNKLLSKLYPLAGPVISKNGSYILEIEGMPAADAKRVGVALGGEVESDIEKQIAAIMSGEQAANARLQAAVDSLIPTHDYHTYSTN
ncbi:MAG: hypothetical protein DWC02_03290 [Candidatus Poseidoniales archaeon]|nr:MAG: hypothetical protein DWC02_03290 [Candidatus Poseidoniales archaeon]